MNNPRPLINKIASPSLSRSFSLIAGVLALLGTCIDTQAALTPNYYFTYPNGGTTYSEGTGYWASTTSTSYKYFFTSTPSGTAGNYTSSTTSVVQFGGASAGTAGIIQVGSSTAAQTTKQPVVGAIVLTTPNAGNYTFQPRPGNVSGNSIQIQGVSDGTTTYGISMTNAASTTTFSNVASATPGNFYVTLLGNQTWANNSSVSGASLNMFSDVNGAYNLNTVGSILLGGSNSFQNLTVQSGTTTVNNYLSINPVNGITSTTNSLKLTGAVAVNSGATLLVTSATNAVAMTASTGGNIVVNDAGSYAITNLTGTLGANIVIGTTNTISGGNTAYFTNGIANTPLSLGTLSLTNNAVLSFYNSSPITASGAVTLSGVNNSIALAGTLLANATNDNIITGSTIIGASPTTISVTGSAVGNSPIAWGSSNTIGRTTYALTNNVANTAIQLSVTGGAWNLGWVGGATGNWDTNTTGNWVSNSTATATTFYAGDNVNFTNVPNTTITVTNAGVAPGFVNLNLPLNSTSTITGGVITNTLAITNAGAGNAVVNSVITGGSISQSGAGTMTLGVANTPASTTISAGQLAINNVGALGTGSVTLSGGNLNLNNLSPTIGNLTLTGGTITAGTGSLTAPNYYINGGSFPAAGVLAASGTVIFGGSGISTLNVSITNYPFGGITSGTLQLQSSNLLQSNALPLISGTLDLNGNTQGFTNISAGAGTIKTGTGTLVWTPSISAQGFTGTVQLDANGSATLSPSVATTVNNAFSGSGTLSLPGLTTATATTFAGHSPAFTGTVLLQGAVAPAVTETLNFGDSLGSATLTPVVGGGQSYILMGTTAATYTFLNPINTATTTDGLKIKGVAGAVENLNGLVTGSGTLTIGTGGYFTLGNTNNNWTGGFSDSHGTLAITNAAVLGSGPFNFQATNDGGANGILYVNPSSGGSVTINNSILLSRVTGGINVVGGIYVTNGTTATLTGSISPDPSTTIPGSTGTNGLIIGGQGTLVLNGTLAPATAWPVNSYISLAVTNGTMAVNAAYTNTLVTVTNGATLAGKNGSLGAVTISQGNLNLDAVSGTRGILSMTNLTLTTLSTLTLDAENLNQSPGTGYDQIQINGGGSIAYNGTLNINSASSLASLFGGAAQSVILFSGMTSPTGLLTAVNFDQTGQSPVTFTQSGGVWTSTGGGYTFNQTTGALAVAAVPEPGTCAMVGLGLSALAVTIIRRRRDA